jgi:hypothetical protein
MLWVSSAWRVKDKVIGTLLVPGGTPIAVTVLFGVLLAFSIIGPFVGASWLSRHARRDVTAAV